MTSTGPKRQWIGALALIVAVGGLAAGTTGCQSGVEVAEMGESAKAGGIQIDVGDYEIRRLHVIEGDRTHEYAKPVLVIPVTFKNVGKDGFRYRPTHQTQQMTESMTPLLYSDPGKGASLPPKNKTPVSGVVLEKGTLEEQITESKVIKPGKSLTDLMLFEVPPEKKANLIFSVPPRMHRGNKPVLFRFPYEHKKPEGKKTYGLGDTANLSGVKFKVKSLETEYIELQDSAQGKAFSSKPLLKISYRIENTSDEDVKYEPGHKTVSGQRGPSLKSGDKTFGRVRFSGNATIKKQINEAKTIKAGKKIEDFSVFERPGKSVKALTFEYPAARFGRGGLVEFNLPYEYKQPDKPKPLKKDEDEEEE